ncbi:MAG: PRC-barrel domain-containing protein [Acidiferrobacterales bacterium]
MLRSMKDLKDYAIRATDGIIGHVKDFYFDDESWVIRYLVVDAGSWLSGRKVLISPIAIGKPDWTEKVLPVTITKEQVKSSPDIDTDKPVSRQHEMRYLGYYGYPNYWGGGELWGGSAYPGTMMPGYFGSGSSTPYAARPEAQEAYARADEARHADDDLHLRSCKEVVGYHIEATDGDIGHVRGMLVDEQTWAIRYMVIDTSNWWLGHQVLVAPQWIKQVSWPESTVSINLTREAVKNAPPYDPAAQLERKQEAGIYEHYGRPGYWADEVKHDAAAAARH